MGNDSKNRHTQESSEKLTPMERQYWEIKSRHRDKILFFRLGDFYEMFYQDAEEAAQILNIALTSRQGMPMCGFPHHAASQYIVKLLQAGKKVAICEQVEDPAKSKGLVKRDIIHIVTPGTTVDEEYINQPQNNFLLSLYGNRERFGLSLVDVSTGEFYLVPTISNQKYRILQDEIARFTPSEIIYNSDLSEDQAVLKELERSGALSQAYPEWYFKDLQMDEDYIANVSVPSEVENDITTRRSVIGALNYIVENQFAKITNLRAIEILNRNLIVEMDDFTIRNLELVRNMQDGGKKYTLLDVLDDTVTAMGGRLLRRWIVMPLNDLSAIHKRQNYVEAFYKNSQLIEDTRRILKNIADIDRLASRVALKRVLPRDLVRLAQSIHQAVKLKELLATNDKLRELSDAIDDLTELANTVDRALYDEPANSFGGKVIRPGYNTELDKARELMHSGKEWIIRLQSRERERTGINSLKVKYNKVFGYFIEVSKANLNAVPNNYIRKQSLVNSERYTIPELSDYEMQITTASEKVERLEEELFTQLVEHFGQYIARLQNIASKVGEIDLISNFAKIAADYNYVKPIVNDSAEFNVKDGRHPVVEKYMGFNLFVPNDTIMDDNENRILLITGPNMAGKSTYLRQNALIAIMAQIGSFVPAKSVTMGLIDRIFTRIGASDQLSAGRSTFLVEMEEAANILRNCTPRSLIIMDELGRGTSTYDGLSIAWAVIEYLHEHTEIAGKTLFATHYHELTRLGEKPGIKNYNIAVKEYKDELVFLRRVVKGPADKSYGIYVAKLAGINDEIIERAKFILESLEKEGKIANERIEHQFDRVYRGKMSDLDLELFPDNQIRNVVEKIRNIDVNRITPLEAITFLSEVKRDLERQK